MVNATSGKRALGILALAGVLGTVACAPIIGSDRKVGKSVDCLKPYAIRVEYVSDNPPLRKGLGEGLVYPESSVPAKIEEDKDVLSYARYISRFEGRRHTVYDPNPKDKRDEPTIGVGHYMGRGDSREFFARVIPEVSFEDALAGRISLTDKQVDALFSADLPVYIQRTRSAIPNFDALPLYIREVLVDMSYRGDLGDSPLTRDLINQRDFASAAEESVNRRDYREAVRKGMGGIRTRLDSHREAFLRYAKELE